MNYSALIKRIENAIKHTKEKREMAKAYMINEGEDYAGLNGLIILLTAKQAEEPKDMAQG